MKRANGFLTQVDTPFESGYVVCCVARQASGQSASTQYVSRSRLLHATPTSCFCCFCRCTAMSQSGCMMFSKKGVGLLLGSYIQQMCLATLTYLCSTFTLVSRPLSPYMMQRLSETASMTYARSVLCAYLLNFPSFGMFGLGFRYIVVSACTCTSSVLGSHIRHVN